MIKSSLKTEFNIVLKNKPFIFSIITIVFILYGTYHFIQQPIADISKFPLHLKSFSYPLNTDNGIFAENASCTSGVFPNREFPTENDVFFCRMYIGNRNNNSFEIKEISIEDIFKFPNNLIHEETSCYSFNDLDRILNLTPNNYTECFLRFNVGNVGVHEKRIRFTFISSRNTTDLRYIYLNFKPLRYNSLSDSQYKEIKNNISTMTFAGIAAIFSSITFIRGLTELYDRKKPKRKKCPKCGKMNEVD